jgi:hypothetical protein
MSKVTMMVMCMVGMLVVTGCDQINVQSPTLPLASKSVSDEVRQQSVEKTMKANQQTPTDIQYSLERYNLIKRAYWVNGKREKAMSVPCAIQRPIGYIVLITGSGAILGTFVVDGKLSSLNSYLTPESEYAEVALSSYGNYSGKDVIYNKWLADIDGCYGSNDKNGVFWFTPDGKYMEWTGQYLYSDIPFKVKSPVLEVNQIVNSDVESAVIKAFTNYFNTVTNVMIETNSKK